MIHVRLLGTLDLRDSEGAELRSILAQPKRTALLAYLAAAAPDGFHRRDTLLPLFWPELDAAHARNALSKAVHHLRRSLGEGVLVNRGDEEVGLCAERILCDVVAFEQALKEGRIAEALELYRGDLLEGFHLSDAPEFERWLERERERLVRSWSQAVTAAAVEQEAAGDYAAASDQWRRLTARDPFNSRTVLRLMQALAASGDRAGALRQARVHSSLLKEEFGAEADPDVDALAERLRNEPPVAPNGRRASPGVPASGGATVDDALGIHTPAERSADPEVLPPVADSDASPATSPPSSAPDLRIPMPRNRRWSAAVALAAAIVLLLVLGLRNETWREWIRQRSDALPPAISSIAVLPLENHTGDPQQDYFVAGMHDALITELAQIGALTVISRQSVLRYLGGDLPLPAIARELDVDGLVGGAVFMSGDSVRITVQLFRAEPEGHLWAATHYGPLSHALGLQGEVARSIARAVRARVAPEVEARLARDRAVDPAAQQAYFRGLYHLERSSEWTPVTDWLEQLQTAIGFLEEAVALDPEWAAAHAKLAAAYHRLANSPVRDDERKYGAEYYPKAKTAALRALALDETEAHAHAVLGFVRLRWEWDWAGAERALQRAMELDPNSYHWYYADYLRTAGRHDEAIAHYHLAEARDPVSEILKTHVQNAYACAGRYDEAIAQARELHARVAASGRTGVPGDSLGLLAFTAWMYSLQGKHAEAIASAEALVALDDSFPARRILAFVYARAGRRDEARVLLEPLEEDERSSGRSWPLAPVYAAMGDTERALDDAEAWFKRWPRGLLPHMRCTTEYGLLRDEPRMQALVRHIGFPQ